MPRLGERLNELSGLGRGAYTVIEHLNAITGNGTAVPYKLESDSGKASVINGEGDLTLASSGATIGVSAGEGEVSLSSAGGKVTLTAGGSICP